MPTPLSIAERYDRQPNYRRVARRYERELKRIRAATACKADQLRRFAAEALSVKGGKK